MRSLIRWEPFDELRSMHHEMDRLFNRFFRPELSGVGRTGTLWMPSVESYTKDGHLFLRAELPGVDQKDLDVSVNGRELILKGERKQGKDSTEGRYGYREIMYGSFERHFVLPEGVKSEELKAKFHNGILEITVPAPMVYKARKIEIEVSKDEKKMIETEGKKAA